MRFPFLERLSGSKGEAERPPDDPKRAIRAEYENELGAIATSDFGGRMDFLTHLFEKYGGDEDALRSALERQRKPKEAIERAIRLSKTHRELVADVGEDTIPPVDVEIDHATENGTDTVGDVPIGQATRDAVEEAIADAPLSVQEALKDPEQEKIFFVQAVQWMKEYVKKNGLTMVVGGGAGFATRLVLKSALGPGMWAAMGVGAGGGAVGGFVREALRQRKESRKITIRSLERVVEEIQEETAHRDDDEEVYAQTTIAAARIKKIEDILKRYGVHGDAGLAPEEARRKIDEIKDLIAAARETLLQKAISRQATENKGEGREAAMIISLLDARQRKGTGLVSRAGIAVGVKIESFMAGFDIERKGLDWGRVGRAVAIGAVAGAAGGAFANYLHDHGWFGGGKSDAGAVHRNLAGAPRGGMTAAAIAAEKQRLAEVVKPPGVDEASLAEAPTTHDTPTPSETAATTASAEGSAAEAVDPAVVRKGEGFWHVVRRQFAAQKHYSLEDLKDPVKLAEVNRETAKAIAKGYTDAEGHHFDILGKNGGEVRLSGESIGAKITVNESGEISIAGNANEMTYPWRSAPDGPAETVGGIEAPPPDDLPVRTFRAEDMRLASPAPSTATPPIEVAMPEVQLAPLPKKTLEFLDEFGPESAPAWAATTNVSEFLGDVYSGMAGERQVKIAHAILGLRLSPDQLEHMTMEDLLREHGAKLKFAFDHDSVFGTKEALSFAKKLGFKSAYEQVAFRQFSVRKFVDSLPLATKDWPLFLKHHEAAFSYEQAGVRFPRITKDHLRLARVIHDLGYDKERLTFGALFADDRRLAHMKSLFDKIKK